jgi:hypothetical protein
MTLKKRAANGTHRQDKRTGAVGDVAVTGYCRSLFSLNGAKGFVQPDKRL